MLQIHLKLSDNLIRTQMLLVLFDDIHKRICNIVNENTRSNCLFFMFYFICS